MDYDYYVNKFSQPSIYYKQFVRMYITERAMIAGRGEEDVSVWKRLEGKELETANQFIFNHLEENPQMPYIRAAGIFRDPKAIPILKKDIAELPERYIIEKLYAAKVLYDWVGYENYIGFLESVCTNSDGSTRNYLKYFINIFIEGLDTKEQQRIKQLLE